MNTQKTIHGYAIDVTPTEDPRHATNLRKLVEALRSGDYLHGTGQLRHEDEGGKFCGCVLGVACDVIDPNRWMKPNGIADIGGWLYEYDPARSPHNKEVGNRTQPPPDIAEAYGFDDSTGFLVCHQGVLITIMGANDGVIGSMLTFEQLADVIEAKYDLLAVAV